MDQGGHRPRAVLIKSVSHLMQRYPNGIAQTITNGKVIQRLM